MREKSAMKWYLKGFRSGIILGLLFMLMASTGWAAPALMEVQPPDGRNPSVTTAVTATFGEAMDPATITTGTFTVSRFVGIKAIVAGEKHTVALKNNGTVVAWGDNGAGQTLVPAGLSGVIAIAAGSYHTVALKNDGTVVTWGNITYNQWEVPAGLSEVIAVAAGRSHTVALKSDGTVVAWGDNSYSQSSVPEGLSGVVAVAAGRFHTVALKNDGTVVIWGNPDGNDNTGQTLVPAGLSGVTAIAAGPYHTLALKNDGTVVAWGANWNGASTVPAGLSGVTAIAAGYGHSVALKNDGTVVAWGANWNGASTVPAGLSGITAISAGYGYSVALKNDGTIVVWGNNDSGQCTLPTGLSGVSAISAGDFDNVALKNDGTVVAWGWNNFGQDVVPAGLSGVTAIAEGSRFTVALKSDGTVVAWGNNDSGQCTVPTTGLSGVTAIAAGGSHSVALKSDGTVVAWGRNDYGQSLVPIGLSGVTAVTAGAMHTVALKSDGKVVAWGRNDYGQSLVPIGLSGVTAVAAGAMHTVALKSDGTVVAWGSNGNAQSTVPANLSGVIAIAAGMNHTLALKSDGTMVAWGTNWYGESTVPDGLSGVTAIAAGAYHAVALKNDGTVVAWGSNRYGEGIVPSPVSPYETNVEGAVTYEQATSTATFTPSAPLELGVTYFASVNTGARSVAGIHLAKDFRWSFGGFAIKTASLPSVAVDSAYTQPLTAAGGTTPYTWSIISGTLPAGLNLEANTGVISGIPTASGTSTFTVQLQDANGDTTTRQLSITIKMLATVTLGNIGQIYDGTPKSATATTIPAGLPVTFTYNGFSVLPTDAGSYDVVATINDSNYQGTASGTLTIGKATGTVTLENLVQGYDGGPMAVTATTTPTGLAVDITYNGSATPPTELGSYAIVATINNRNFQGSANGTLYINTLPTVVQVQPPNGSNPSVTTSVTATFSEAMDPATITPGSFAVSYGGIKVIAAGTNHTVALKDNGKVIAWGSNFYGESTVPSELSGVTAIAAGAAHTVALKDNGKVIAWGSNSNRQAEVPAGLSGVTAIAAGFMHDVALKSDGTVVAWGASGYDFGQTAVPAGLSGVIAIAAGGNHTLALKNDGTVVMWGDNSYGMNMVPAGLSGVIAIAAGTDSNLALKSDGTVVAWGWNGYLSCNVPEGLSGVIAIAAGSNYSAALKNDGTVVAWGAAWNGNYGQTTVPEGLSDVTAISAGYGHIIALKKDDTLVAWGLNDQGQSTVPAASSYETPVAGIVAFDQATNTANFSPSAPLESGVNYFAALSTDVRSAAGVHLSTDFRWNFGGVAIKTSSLLGGSVDYPYNQLLSATGGKTPYTWSIISGNLPSGLSLDANIGVISGIPTEGGAKTFTVQVQDANGATSSRQLSIFITSPDLILTTVNATPIAVNPGDSVTVTAEVKNQGQWNAGASNVGIYLSMNANIDGSDTYVGTISVPALAVGASATVSGTFAAPMITSGVYYVGGIADANNSVAESGETNNVLAGNQIGIGMVNPPLVWFKDADADGYSDGTTITQWSRPAGYKTVSELAATSGDCNDNNASIHPGAVEIPLNGIDENCDGMTDDAATPTAAILQPAADISTYYGEAVTFEGSTGTIIAEYAWYLDGSLISNQRYFSYSILPVGPHTITYKTKDSIGRWSDPVSRQVTSVFQPARVDLALEWGDISFWQNGIEVTNPGESDPVTIRATIHNLSSEVASLPGSVNFYDTYVTGNQGQVFLGSADIPVIAPNGTAVVEIFWTPDSQNPQPGYHLIQVSAGKDANETYLDNNTATHHIVRGDRQAAGNVVIDIKNLNVSNLQQMYVGTRFILSGYAQYHWQNGYLLPVLGGKVTIRLGDQVYEARTGSNGWFYQEVVMPLTANCSSLAIEVSDATISGQTQLSLCSIPVPYAGPDLIVHSISLANGVAQMPETVYAYVANRGGDVASGPFSTHIEVAGPAGEIVFTDTKTYDNPNGLGPGSGVTLHFGGWTPAVAGNYRLTVITDYTNNISESDENNNTTTVTLYVYPHQVDLQVVEIRQSCNTVSALITNSGGLNSTTGTVHFADESGDFGTAALPPVPGKGGGVWVTAIPYGGLLANTRITVSVESTEDAVAANNTRTAVLDFTPKSDLTVSNLRVNDQSWSGANTVYISQPNTLWAEVRNLGCNSAGGTLQFYVDWAAKGELLTVPEIPGGGSAVVSTTFDFAGYTAATNYTLSATVNVPLPYIDAVPGNNTLTEVLTVSPQLPDYRVYSEDIRFSVDPGHPARNEKFIISADIHNVGLAEGNEFNVAFYEDGRTLIGAVQTIRMNPGIQPSGVLTVYPRDAAGNVVEWGSGFSGNHAIMVTVAPVAGIENDPNDTDNSATRKVWVNYPPQASVAATSTATTAFSFDASGSNDDLDIDGKGGIVRYDWDFGDGQTASNAGPTLSHAYPGGGNYTATVTVVDNNSESATASMTVVVPYYTIGVNPSGGLQSGQTVLITGDAGGINCQWSGSATSGVCTADNILSATRVVLTASLPDDKLITWGAGCDTFTATTCTINSLTADTTVSPVISPKAPQTIDFNPPTGKIFGDLPFDLSAYAPGGASGNPVTFTVTSGPGVLNGNTLTIIGAGDIVITASQAGDANYLPATDVQKIITVAKASAVVTLGNLSHTFDGTSKSVTASTTPSGLAVDITYDGSVNPPAAAGSYAVVAVVNDPNYQGSASDVLVIYPPLIIDSTPLPPGDTGYQYLQALTATGGLVPYSWSVSAGSLPPGLTLDSATGTIFGTSVTPGVYTFDVQVAEANGTNAVQTFSITIVAKVYIATTSLSAGSICTSYTQTLSALEGTKPYNWSAISGALPGGLHLNNASGEISGIPNQLGTFAFTIKVTDAKGITATKDFTININDLPPDLVVSSVVASVSAGNPQQLTITATVRNQGQGGAGRTFVNFYLSPDATITTNDQQFRGVMVDGVPPGGEQTVTITQIANGIAAGTYYPGAIVDQLNNVVESDETNNWLAGDVVVIN
ncbi:MAG: putative Ig domain-containing protein [Geobacter sp.]|nr:putative Ig domain-containing protein [Geobacter sp.]